MSYHHIRASVHPCVCTH